VAAVIAASGTLIYLLRAKRIRDWPFSGIPKTAISQPAD
jgi:hypothetical protein